MEFPASWDPFRRQKREIRSGRMKWRRLEHGAS